MNLLKVFLAGRQSRRDELIRYRKQMEEQGLVSCASWLDDGHDVHCVTGDGLVIAEKPLIAGDFTGCHHEPLLVDAETHRRLAGEIAQRAFDDVFACDIFILFTEETPRSRNSTRLAQLGIALARHKQVIMVGWRRETLVGWMRRVTHVQTWEEALILISRRALEGIGAIEPEGR